MRRNLQQDDEEEWLDILVELLLGRTGLWALGEFAATAVIGIPALGKRIADGVRARRRGIRDP